MYILKQIKLFKLIKNGMFGHMDYNYHSVKTDITDWQ